MALTTPLAKLLHLYGSTTPPPCLLKDSPLVATQSPLDAPRNFLGTL